MSPDAQQLPSTPSYALSELKHLLEQLEAVPAAQRAAFIAAVAQREPTLAGELASLAVAMGAPTQGGGNSSSIVQASLAQSPLSTPLSTSQQIGPWRITGELGRGGMGVVYAAQRADGTFTRTAAIKVLPPVFATPQLTASFARETQTLARMDHPHIARLIDAGTTPDGLAYIVMEAVAGTPITQWANANTSNAHERLRLMLDLCDAVAYAHRQLLVHRDLKPANVLVNGEGQVKLLDFGISKLLDASSLAEQAATQEGRAFTPAYSSPEQVQGQFVSTATDIFSLGILLYEILTGINPFRREDNNLQASNMAIMQAITSFDPQAPSQLARAVDADVDAIVLTALAKDPNRRYRSVDALAQDIRRYLDGFPIAARTPSVALRALKFVRRNPYSTALAALALVSIGVGLTTTLIQKNRAEAKSLQLLELSNSIVFQYYNGVLSLPGSLPVRQQMMRDASTQLDKLSAEAGDDVEVLVTLAESYRKLAQALFAYGNVAQVGDRAGGDAARTRGLALATKALALKPKNPIANKCAAAITSDQGLILANEGKTADALALLNTAIEYLKVATKAAPKDASLWHDLAQSQVRAANALITNKQSGQAYIADAQAAFEQWLAVNNAPDAKDRVYLKTYLLGAQQREATRAGDTPLTLKLLDEQAELLTALAATLPDDTTTQQHLASALLAKGTALLLDSKDYAAALAPLDRGLAVLQREYARDPSDMRLLSNIARVATHRGNALLGAGAGGKGKALAASTAQAEQAFADSVAAWDKSLLKDTRPHVKRQAAEAYWRLMTVHVSQAEQGSRGTQASRISARKLLDYAEREPATFAKPPAAEWLAQARVVIKP